MPTLGVAFAPAFGVAFAPTLDLAFAPAFGEGFFGAGSGVFPKSLFLRYRSSRSLMGFAGSVYQSRDENGISARAPRGFGLTARFPPKYHWSCVRAIVSLIDDRLPLGCKPRKGV
jgi:hypothetical protein